MDIDHGDERHRLTRRRSQILLTETTFGFIVGVVFGLCGGLIGVRLGRGMLDGWGDVVGSFLGSYGGYMLGVPVGITLTARRLKQRGAFWRSLGGSVLGGIGVLALAEPLHLNRETNILLAAFGVLVLVGAMVAFHSRRGSLLI